MYPILSKIFRLDQLNVIGVTRTDAGNSYCVLKAKRSGNKTAITKISDFDVMETLIAAVGTKLPVIIVIEGKGVLHKKVDFDNPTDANWYKSLDFSTINYTGIKSTNSNFMSFCRQNIVDEIVSEFHALKFDIIDVYIGSFLSALLYPSINKPTLFSDGLRLEFADGMLVDYSKTDQAEEYVIGEDLISSRSLPLYGVLVDFLLHPEAVSKTQYQSLDADEHLYRKAFNFLGTLMLVGFMVALLASYLLLQYYQAKNQELSNQHIYSDKSYLQTLHLEKLREDKLKVAGSLGLSSKKFLSFYAYEILQSIPSGIDLGELSILPEVKEVKSNMKMHFETNTIVVKGETYDTTSLNKWFESLRKMNWIKKYEIVSVKKDKKNKSQFELKITLADV